MELSTLSGMSDGEPDFAAPYRMYMPDGELIEVVPTYAEQETAQRQYEDYRAYLDDDQWYNAPPRGAGKLADDDDPPF